MTDYEQGRLKELEVVNDYLNELINKCDENEAEMIIAFWIVKKEILARIKEFKR